jgi:predicted nucleic acid-binding protein
MAFTAVLDACVLYPFSLRDSLLRLAARELYDVRWSQRILDETIRNLVDQRISEEQAAHLTAEMTRAFPEACVPEEAIAALEGSMTNDAKDRHVLAAAVAGGAEALVTFNLRHFPDSACAPYSVTPLHPDEFLLNLHAIEPRVVTEAITAQASVLHKPPKTFDELLEMLAIAGVPHFAAALRT